MGEIRRRVHTYAVDMLCPKCGEGIMRPEGRVVLLTSPPQYPHKCDKCGHIQSFFECYPRVEYEVIQDGCPDV